MTSYLVIFVLCFASEVFGSAAVVQQERMKAAQQQAYQQAMQEAYQQEIARRQQEEIQAYQQAVAQYQMAQYQAAQIQMAQQYIAQQQYQAMVQAQIAQYIQAQQMEAIQQVMLKRAVEQALMEQIAQQIQAKIAVRIQEEMVAKAVFEAVQRLQMERYINEAAQQKAAAQVILATKAAYQFQAEQIQAAQQIMAQAQMQQNMVGSIRKYIKVQDLQDVQLNMLKKAVEQLLLQYVARQIQEKKAVEVSQQVVEAALGQAVGILGFQKYQNEAAEAIAVKTLADNQQVPEQVEDIVDAAELYQSMVKSSKAWTLLIEPKDKVMVANEFIERWRLKGVVIKKPASFYAETIEQMAASNPSMLDNPFDAIIQMIAIMEYDFDNGMSKEDLARKLLGPAYEKNKKRLGR